MTYQCEVCNVTFSKLSQLLQHRRTENHWPKFTCPSCKKSFTRKNNLKQHMKKHEDGNNHHCPECLRVFTRRDALDEHFKQHENQSGGGRKRSSGDDADSNATNKKQKLSAKDDVKDYYRVDKISERRIEKFNSTASYYKISVKDMEIRELPNIIKTLKQIFQSIIDTIAGNIPSSDRVRVTMDNPQLDFPIVLRFMKRSELTVDRLLSEIERVLQSYEQFVLDETFGLEFVHVHLPNGSGTRGKPFVDISKLLNNKASVLQIRNTDELCCARAIVTAIARIEKHPQWNNIRLGHHAQKQLALNLHDKAGVPLQRCGIDEVKLFQSALPDYKIVVLSKDHFNAIIYEGQEDGIPIYLYSHNEHFDVITSVAGFLNRSYFCLKCKKGYSNKEQHACNNPCVHCHRIHDDDSFNWEHCIDCNRNFMNETCFAMHKQNHDVGTSTCSMYYKCKDCGQAINVRKHKKAHVCNEKYCKTCKEFVEEDHQCFMQPTEESESERETVKKKTNDTKYIFFDFECTQDQQLQCENGYLSGVHGKCVNCNKATCGSYKHQPNLCVAQRVCRHCLKNDLSSESECEYCGRNELIFKGEQTTQQFCKWLFSEENVGATVICHNFKGYDSYPILQYLHENAILPEVITNGTKFMSIKVPVCKMRFIDSINFIPMALADMPKAFGIAELSKGYFPHLYNRQENQTQTLTSLPDSKYYYPDGMKIDKRLEFIAWYDIHKNDAFDFQYELLKYCRSDVDILRKCCLKFRELFQDITHKNDIPGIDPFEKCLTIASACNLVFRRNFLEHESIGIIPSHGYRPEEKQSVMAYQWMAYLAHEKQINIQHGRNNGEKHIGPYKVDGYYERDGEKVVLEFHGCFWHGCSKCFSSKTVNPVNDMKVKNVRFVNEEAVQLDWVHGNDFVDDSSRTNVVIAAYTTAQARLKLYSYLQRLGQRCLYCDTDSIIFISRPGQWRPSLGDHLGEMTDEVSGNKITNFVTGGPKNYAYKTESCDKNGYFSICKVKGITLNFKNTLKINYDMVVDMVRGSSASSSVQVQDMKICRDITQTNIITRQETKDYRIVFDKRVIHENYLTYPYGY
ncbi:ZN777-like protein [Mya arenaria]|uniref:DNA-directed DNA polymerase n=1 Tax=Mya arenaria TaxID=6604 RepID=A0ABY7ETN6_MYAAR|nr:ZN777-like protein [Mya arenaria]